MRLTEQLEGGLITSHLLPSQSQLAKGNYGKAQRGGVQRGTESLS